MRDRFSTCHPIINFTFFIGALVFGMILMHPGFLVCSMLLSAVYYLTIKGRKGMRFLGRLFVLFLVLSALNPLFAPYGEHILFTYFGGRIYTLEALCYGMVLSAMVVSVLSWFASYNEVMTSDKFLYLFGRLSPSVTMILTMVLRLIPSYKKKIVQMNGARQGIGLSKDAGSKREKAEHGLVLISALTSWALEGGIITADSMRSRGYGAGKRTSFSLYRMEGRDKVLLGVLVVLLAVLIFCGIKGGAAVTYSPKLHIAGFENPYTCAGLIAYGIFLSIPSVLNIGEEMRWRSLKSKI